MFSYFGNTQYLSIQTIDTRTPYSYSIITTNGIMFCKLYEFFHPSFISITYLWCINPTSIHKTGKLRKSKLKLAKVEHPRTQNQHVPYNQMYYLIHYKSKSKSSKVGHLRTHTQYVQYVKKYLIIIN